MTNDPLAEAWDNGVLHGRCCPSEFVTTPCLSNPYREGGKTLADAVRVFLAEHVAKPEVVEAVGVAIRRTHSERTAARAALAALLETLRDESNE